MESSIRLHRLPVGICAGDIDKLVVAMLRHDEQVEAILC
jgi:hypothetical protein